MPLTYLTDDLPGIGGVLKQRPEDFLVEEQPLYEPSDTGEHLFLFIEKTRLSTTDVVRVLAKAFHVRRGEIGYAGMKDKHAVTRQHFSICLTRAGASEEEAAANLEHHPRLKVLWTARHQNKLRRGHLAGNRFVIRVREVAATAAILAKPLLDRLAAAGIPNYIGEQRFGYRHNNHLLGQHLLLNQHQALLNEMLGRPEPYESPAVQLGRAAYDAGDYQLALDHWPKMLRHDRQALDALRQGKSAELAVRAIDRVQRDFMITAWQSQLFNEVLDRRVRDGLLDRLIPGDLAWKHDNRAVFAVDQATAAAENSPDGRVPRLEVSPSGPMWGTGMTRADGEPGRIEEAVLTATGINESHFDALKDASVEGSRRALRVPLRDAEISSGMDEHGPYVRVAFELPRGAFATTVLREIMKTDLPEDESEG